MLILEAVRARDQHQHDARRRLVEGAAPDAGRLHQHDAQAHVALYP